MTNEARSNWEYFSRRADQAADGLRGILFLSANGGLAVHLSGIANVLSKNCGSVSIGSLTFFFAAAAPVCLAMAMATIISSWMLQKDKAMERRKKQAQRANGALDELEGDMGTNSAPNKSVLSESNRGRDLRSLIWLSSGYLFMFATVVFYSGDVLHWRFYR
ncbi:MAG: hypothetical protein WAW96_01345 [Alphaproteobacteria bacterium]